MKEKDVRPISDEVVTVNLSGKEELSILPQGLTSSGGSGGNAYTVVNSDGTEGLEGDTLSKGIMSWNVSGSVSWSATARYKWNAYERKFILDTDTIEIISATYNLIISGSGTYTSGKTVYIAESGTKYVPNQYPMNASGMFTVIIYDVSLPYAYYNTDDHETHHNMHSCTATISFRLDGTDADNGLSASNGHIDLTFNT